ncbi:MAG: hypothetical protein JRG91_15210, partial [Deltaproteobacteria bacterium]|nr:hypothetical protein [Deltaproteobacteria bacterium]
MGHPSRLEVILAALLVLGGCGSDANPDEDASDVNEEEVTVIDVAEETPCTSDDECDNGLFCDGEETCDSGECQPGTAVDCDDSDPCTMDSCDDDLGTCVNDTLDADDDGYAAITAPTGEDCGGTDCDDTLDDWHPDAPETGCDLLDKDCDGENSEGIDDDGDGWIDAICDGLMSEHTHYHGFGDCDDDGDHMPDDPPNTIYPGAPEGCDATIDHDCDGDSTEVDTDFDGDGFPPESCVEEGETFDCDDSDDTVYPEAPEVCDLIDNDCDRYIMDAPGIDDDGDGVPDEACGGNDCNDDDSSIHGTFIPPTGMLDLPETTPVIETCDDVDDDCDGSWADGGADDDGDTVLDILCGGTDCNDDDISIYPGATRACGADHDCDTISDDDSDEDGHVWDVCSGGDDCNDDDDTIYWGAPLSCDSVDHDCNTFGDQDNDDDGHLRTACGGDDCDDSEATIYTGAPLSCDSVDHDCNTFGDEDNDNDGQIRVGCTTGTDCNDADDTIYDGAPLSCDTIDHDCNTFGDQDNDDDGHLRTACGGDDCDDSEATIYTGAPLSCDSIDHDCNTYGDEDNDNDGHIRDSCSGGDDCNDTDVTIYAGATLSCDSVDHDCNGFGDQDNDNDTYIRDSCSGGDDCNDGDSTIHPGGTLSCDSIDHDCNTYGDEDNDNDGHIRDTCSGGDDCNDADATIYAGAPLSCDSVDHDCNTYGDQDNDNDTYIRDTCSGGDDCDDTDAVIHPGATVTCTAVDRDCNTNPDEDNDGDTYVRIGCTSGDDCDDTDTGIYPGAAVTCTAVDRDCNTHPDNDQDGDSYIRESIEGTWPACTGGTDCDDHDGAIYPGASTTCDDVDDDCTGSYIDETDADDDGDLFLDATCTGGDDCDDTDARIHPSPPLVVPDVCWRDDYDCDTILDPLGTVASVDIDVERGFGGEPAIAWSGTEYGVVWRETGSVGTDLEIHFTRMDATGVEVGSPIELTSDTTSNIRPDIAWSGAKWGVVFQDDTNDLIYFMTMDPDGTGASTPVLVTAACDTGEQRPHIAGDGTGFGIAWRCQHSGARSIQFQTGDAAGALVLGSPVDLIDNG